MWFRFQDSRVLQLILPHMVDHTFMTFPVPLQTLWTPCTIFVPFMFPISSLKTPVIFHMWILNPFSCIHVDITLKHVFIGMCAKGQIFWSFPWCGSESLVSWISICLNIAWIWPSITPLKHYIRNHLDTLKREELKSKKTIVHCCCSLLILEFASLCTLDHLVFFPSFPFIMSLLSRDGGLRWWRPRWRTQFI